MRVLMMKVRRCVFAVSVALLYVGCAHFSEGNLTADFPEGEQFPQIYQAKMMAAAHWQLIAENEASLMARRFEPGSAFTLATSGPGQSTDMRSDFAQAYHHMLGQGLLNNEMRVFDQGGDFQLGYDIQVLSHQERTQRNLPAGYFTGSTVAAFAIKEGLKLSKPELMLFPIAAGLDAYSTFNSDTGTPNTEIILTTTARANTELVYSNSSVYYFRAVDQELYDGVEPEEHPGGFNVMGPRGGGS